MTDRTERGVAQEGRHDAVAEATRRTRHDLAGGGARDPRYGSDDPAVDRLWVALGEVADPELPVSLVDLGLVRGVALGEDGTAGIDLTFTATACPCMEFIRDDVRERLLREPGVRAVEIREVWDPPWTAERMTDAARAMLKSAGVAA